jgi:hypothetical protein
MTGIGQSGVGEPGQGTVSELDAEFDHSIQLDLKVASWVQVFHSSREKWDEFNVSLTCVWLTSPYHLTVGQNPIEDLKALPVCIETRGKPPDASEAGYLFYNRPISSGDGVVDDKAGSVIGGVFLGTDLVRDLSRALTLQPEPIITIGLTVAAKSLTTPGALHRAWRDAHRPKYHWDGGEGLRITNAEIRAVKVTAVEPPQSSTEADQDKVNQDTVLSICRELVSGMTRITNTTRTAVGVLVCILIELWLHH